MPCLNLIFNFSERKIQGNYQNYIQGKMRVVTFETIKPQDASWYVCDWTSDVYIPHTDFRELKKVDGSILPLHYTLEIRIEKTASAIEECIEKLNNLLI